MQLTGRKTEVVSLDVSERDVIHAVIGMVRKHADINESNFLSDGKVKYDDPDHRHGSIQEMVKRVATQDDLKAFEVIAYLEQMKKGM